MASFKPSEKEDKYKNEDSVYKTLSDCFSTSFLFPMKKTIEFLFKRSHDNIFYIYKISRILYNPMFIGWFFISLLFSFILIIMIWNRRIL